MPSKICLSRQELVKQVSRWTVALSVCLLLPSLGGCPATAPDDIDMDGPTDSVQPPTDADTPPPDVDLPPADQPESVAESLTALGVNTTETPRVVVSQIGLASLMR